jgi:hypothetical protein
VAAAFLNERHNRVGVRREGEFSRAILFLFELRNLLIDGGGGIGGAS